ncbi:MAG: hypothetical protein VYA80_01055 [Pseudomonadota bacterium]|nr:hypothetical protein [Pseudomonadota bacterium]
MSKESTHQAPIRYEAWWGLAGCGLIIGLIMLIGPYREFELTPRTYIFDYPWKLPDPTVWTRVAVWSLYALHQVGVWYLIYKAQSMKLRYVNGLHRINVQMLVLNLTFVALHIGQTLLTYDGLAQDVHEGTAFGSVALMLFVILIMENDRRGLILGKRIPFPKGIGESARKYHGYYFSWAITYTFWYHPIEITGGHLMGLFYMMMLFLQGSLFLTRFHVNRWWTLFLEFFVVIHGSTVAYIAIQMSGQHWSSFLFGGVFVFLITQLHGVKLKLWHKISIATACIGSALIYYSGNPDLFFENIPRMVSMRYLGVAVLVCLIWLIMRPFIWSGKKVPGIKSG